MPLPHPDVASCDAHPSTLSSIRERTRNAIAQHRAWRHHQPTDVVPDLRRTYRYAGTTSSAGDDPSTTPPKPRKRHALPVPTQGPQFMSHCLELKPSRRSSRGVLDGISRETGTMSASNGLSAADDVYREIEAQDRQQQANVAKQQQVPLAAIGRSPIKLPALERNLEPLNNSMENHLQSLEDRFTPSPQTKARSTSAPTMDRKTVYVTRRETEENERATIVPPRILYSELNRALGQMYSIPPSRTSAVSRPHDEAKRQLQQDIVYRDEGSVMTGMSQQELIRKKKKTLRQQRKKKFGAASAKRKTKKSPIVQLPASLFSMQPSARISLPHHQYYLPHSSVNGDDIVYSEYTISEEEKVASRLAAIRWGSNPRSTVASSPPPLVGDDLDSFSTTAEITNASGESVTPFISTTPIVLPSGPGLLNPTALKTSQLSPPSFSVLDIASSREISLTLSSVSVQEQGNKEVNMESDCYSPEQQSFPVLSRSYESAELNLGHESSADQRSSSNTSENTSSFNNFLNEATTERKGVRFANIIYERYSAGDDWSEVPWDQKKDQQQVNKTDSPCSVITPMQTDRPKSILRTSRFGPDPSPSLKCRRMLDVESERLLYTSDIVDDAMSREVMWGASQALHSDEADGTERNRDLVGNYVSAVNLNKAKLAMCREVNSSLEVSPPRRTEFFDREGLELSPIRAESSHETTDFLPGHPAEKHLRRQMAMVRDIRGGGIAHQVMEETQYPDPPIEINMDDDETVMSAYAFIETVAAIVVQTAARQFLATLYVDSLRQTRESLHLISRIRSVEHSTIVGEHSSPRELSVVDAYAKSDGGFVDNSETTEDDLDNVALDLYHLAALQIQSVFRGFWIRDCLDVDHYCTTVLQRAYRGYVCRKRVQYDINRIITAQSWVRRNIARDEAASILAYAIIIQAIFRGHRVRESYKIYQAKVASSKIKAAIMIQWIWRGYYVRKRYGMFIQIESRIRQAAATIIQSRWRSFVCEANFIRTLVDVLIAQTVVRRWLAKIKVAAVKRQLLRSEKRYQSTKSLRHVATHQKSAPDRSLLNIPTKRIQSTTRESSIAPTQSTNVDVLAITTSRQVCAVNDPPGYSASSRPFSNKQRPAVKGLKSKVVAYPMLDGDDDGGFMERMPISSYVDKVSAQSNGLKVQKPDAEKKQVKSYSIDTDKQRQSGPRSGTTGSMLSIWKEKEKNSLGIQTKGIGVDR